jgi:CheY-like chemotaxis protein
MAVILIIDDSKLSRTMTVKALETEGHTIVEAADGEQGLASVEIYRPDCIITDLLMPVLDGHGFLSRLRGRGINTPVIVLSADIQSSTRKMCEEHGILSFINKPIMAEALREGVRQALAATRGTPICG